MNDDERDEMVTAHNQALFYKFIDMVQSQSNFNKIRSVVKKCTVTCATVKNCTANHDTEFNQLFGIESDEQSNSSIDKQCNFSSSTSYSSVDQLNVSTAKFIGESVNPTQLFDSILTSIRNDKVCLKCHALVNFIVKEEVIVWPDKLTFVINRGYNERGEKDQKFILVNPIEQFDKKGPHYKCTSITFHIGDTINEGHYKVGIIKSDHNGIDRFYLCDDSNITEFNSFKNLCKDNSKNAYILTFKKITDQSEIGGNNSSPVNLPLPINTPSSNTSNSSTINTSNSTTTSSILNATNLSSHINNTISTTPSPKKQNLQSSTSTTPSKRSSTPQTSPNKSSTSPNKSSTSPNKSSTPPTPYFSPYSKNKAAKYLIRILIINKEMREFYEKYNNVNKELLKERGQLVNNIRKCYLGENGKKFKQTLPINFWNWLQERMNVSLESQIDDSQALNSINEQLKNDGKELPKAIDDPLNSVFTISKECLDCKFISNNQTSNIEIPNETGIIFENGILENCLKCKKKCKHQLISVEGAVNITISVARNGDSKRIDFQKYSTILGPNFKVSAIVSNGNKNAKNPSEFKNVSTIFSNQSIYNCNNQKIQITTDESTEQYYKNWSFIILKFTGNALIDSMLIDSNLSSNNSNLESLSSSSTSSSSTTSSSSSSSHSNLPSTLDSNLVNKTIPKDSMEIDIERMNDDNDDDVVLLYKFIYIYK